MPVHPAQVPSMSFATSLDSPLPHCDYVFLTFQLDYQMYLMPLPKGMDVGNIPKVLKIPNKNEMIDLQVNYFYALEPENYLSNHGKKTVKKSMYSDKIDSIDDILANIGQTENFQNGFQGSPDGKCVKMEQFPKGFVHKIHF